MNFRRNTAGLPASTEVHPPLPREAVSELIVAFGNRLLIDPVPGYPVPMCWRSIARDFGLKRWQQPGKKLASISNLLNAAWTAGPEVFKRFVTCSLKRAVRLSRLRGRRPSVTNICGPQPFWLEDAKRINSILKDLGQGISELEDPVWLRGFPRRSYHNL